MWLKAFLLYDFDGALPGAGAGAEAMGRARVTVIALTVVNLSHVTAPLLYSLFLCVRQHKAGTRMIQSK